MRVLVIGDSQAEGAPGAAFAAALNASGVQTQRIGHVGHGAYDWTRMHWPEYQAALQSFQPDQVVLIFGSNDPPNANLEQAMRAFKASAPKVFYAGPPRYDSVPTSQAMSAGIRDMAKRVYGDKHLDAWPYTGPSVSRAGDGLHFTLSGGAAWAAGMVDEWKARLSGAVAAVPAWTGPVVLGSAAALLLGLWWWSKRHD